MTFILCSKKPDEKTAFISFSGSRISKFGFHAGSKVAVDISKGKIVITVLQNTISKESDNSLFERI